MIFRKIVLMFENAETKWERGRWFAIAQSIRLRLPSWQTRFEFQAYQLRFLIYERSNCLFVTCIECKKNENKQEEAGIGHLKKIDRAETSNLFELMELSLK